LQIFWKEWRSEKLIMQKSICCGNWQNKSKATQSVLWVMPQPGQFRVWSDTIDTKYRKELTTIMQNTLNSMPT
jgi:hypothetical protein